jgi:Tol biopolymer transport system component
MRILRVGIVLSGLILAITSSLMIVQRRTPSTASQILYISRDLYIMWADGSHSQPLSTYFDIDLPQYMSDPRLSPDGEWLVYQQSLHLYRLRLADGHIELLTDASEASARFANIAPTWSPNAQQVIYIQTERGGGFTSDLMRLRVDGTNTKRLFQSDEIQPIDPVWSPDGKWLIFRAYRQTEEDILYRMNLDDFSVQPMTDSTFGLGDGPVAWSPDSQWIAVSARGNIFKMRADGSDVQQLTATLYDVERFPAWSPDGKWITFTSRTNGNTGLYRMRIDGNQREVLIDSGIAEIAVSYSPIIDKPFAGVRLFGLGLFFLIGGIGIARRR